MREADLDSTLIRRGRKAVTFADMAEFGRTLENRPMAAVIGDLPELARLSEPKFILATKILRRRFDGQQASEQNRLRVIAHQIAASINDADENVADRIRSLFEVA